jgi:hypothetical protein
MSALTGKGLAFLSNIRYNIDNMLVRDIKNRAFDALTPDALRPVYKEHGREIANAESGARIVAAPYFAWTAATGRKGLIPGLARVIKMVNDGHDGFVAEQDKEFGKVKPTIFSAGEMTMTAIKGLRDGQGFDAIMHALHETDGKTLDQAADKVAQVADQIGGAINGDLSWRYVGLNVARNAWINRGVRPTYKALGVEGAGGATAISQIKTCVQDGHQALEAFGVLDHAPQVRKAAEVIGVSLVMYSAADIMLHNEAAYLDQIGLDPTTIHPVEQLMSSTARTLAHLRGADPARPGPQILSPIA